MRKIMFLAALLLFLPMVFSLTINGSCDDKVVQCEVSINNLEVCNDSSNVETFFISKTGVGAGLVELVPEQMTLEPGECEELNNFTVSNCYAEPGVYPYQIIIQDGVRETINCELTIEQGHEVQVEITPKTQTANQCEEKTYEVTLTNNSLTPNQNTEFVSLELFGDAKEWSELSEKELEVTRGEPKTIELKVKAPCNQELGEYTIGVRAVLYNKNFYSEDTAKYIITNGQELIISSDMENNVLEACEEQKQVYFISLKNNGVQDDEFELNLIGPSFAKLKENKVFIQSGTTKDIELTLNKTTSNQKEFDLTLEAKSTKFNYETSEKFLIELNDCYALNLELIDGKKIICSEEQNDYKFKVTNLKNRKINVDLKVTGVQGSLSDNAIVLNGFEEKEIIFTPNVKNIVKEGTAVEEQTNLELVLDTSGSMNEKIENEKKIDSAKKAANQFVSNITNVKLGIRVFGQGPNTNNCIPSELVYEIKELDSVKASQAINSLTPSGKTPLTEAITSSVKDLNNLKGKKVIVLVSDGKETCGGNINLAISEAKKTGIQVYTVGFNIDEDGKQELVKIANKTNGKYFDASNANELIQALQKISRELKITKSVNKNISFTITADSEFTKDSEKVNARVEDCYNSALLIPELVLCKGIPFNDFITINNLGTKTTEFNITGLPEWIEVQDTVTIPANGKKLIPFTANPLENSNEEEFTIKLTSKESTITQTKPIIYLPFESCNAIDLITLKNEINAKVCEGKKFKLIIENNGKRKQTISLKTNIPWVYIIQDKIKLEAGERKEINYYVSPPFDLRNAVTPITITAKTNTGFETSITINLIKTGEGFGLEKVNMNLLNNEKTLEINDYNKGQLIEFEIENDSNRLLIIQNIQALKYNAEFELKNNRLKPHRITKAKMMLKINQEKTIIIPIKFTTNQGTYIRDIKINAVKKENQTTPQVINEPIPIGSGLFSLLGLSGTILGLILLVALIIGGVIYQTQKNKKQENTEKTNANPTKKNKKTRKTKTRSKKKK